MDHRPLQDDQSQKPFGNVYLLASQLIQTLPTDRIELIERFRREHSEEAFPAAAKELLRKILEIRNDARSLSDLEAFAPGIGAATIREVWDEFHAKRNLDSYGTVAFSVEDSTPETFVPDRGSDSLDVKPTSVAFAEAVESKSKFRKQSEHASGGLGVVFRAEDTQLDRVVALKQIREEFADKTSYREKFVREAMVTGRLEHPSIVPVYSIGNDAKGRPFYVMRFVKGQTLKDRIEAFHLGLTKGEYVYDSMPLRKLLRRFVDACHAIDYAHSRGVIHRDLKPSNIMLGKYGETLVVDWGLARAFEKSSVSNQNTVREASQASEMALVQSDTPADALTQMGSFVGSIPYASPEQLRGDLDALCPATDIYSLGAVLFEILTSKPSVQNFSNVKELADEIILGKMPSPRSVSAIVPGQLDAICKRAMAGRISDRYQSANDLRLDIESFLDDEPFATYRDSITDKARRVLRKRPALFSGLSALVLAGLCFAAVFAFIKSQQNETLKGLNNKLEVAQAQALSAEEEATSNASEASRSAEEASEQRKLARDTIVKLVREVNEGQEDGRDIAAIRQNLFSVLIGQFDQLTSGTASDPSSRLEVLSAKVGLAKSVAQLGRVSSNYEKLTNESVRSDTDIERNLSLKRELNRDDLPRTSFQEKPIESSVKTGATHAETRPIFESLRDQFDAECRNLSDFTGDQYIRLLRLYLDSAISSRDVELNDLAIEQCQEIVKLCESYSQANSKQVNDYGNVLDLIRLQALRLKGMCQIESNQESSGIKLLWVVRDECMAAANRSSPGFPLLLAKVLLDLGTNATKEESFTSRYNMLSEANDIAKDIEDPTLESDAKQICYSALVKMSIMKSGVQPDQADQLMKQARELYGESFDQQLERFGLQDRRRFAWSIIHQGDALPYDQTSLDKAAKLYEQAFQKFEAIYQRNPSSRESQRDLATAHERRGIVALRKLMLSKQNEDLTEPKSHFEKMLAIKKSLAESQDDWLAQIELGITYSHFAEMASFVKDNAQAIRWYEDQIAVLQSCFERFPSESEVQRYLVLAHWDLGYALELSKSYTRAREEYLKSAESCSALNMGESRATYVKNLQTRIDSDLQRLEGLTKALLPLDELLITFNTDKDKRKLQFALIERLRWLVEAGDNDELYKTLKSIDNHEDKRSLGYEHLIAGYVRLANILTKNQTQTSSGFDSEQALRRAEELAYESIVGTKLSVQSFRDLPVLSVFRESNIWDKFHRPDPKLRDIVGLLMPFCAQVHIVDQSGVKIIQDGMVIPDSVYSVERLVFKPETRPTSNLLERLKELSGLREVFIEQLNPIENRTWLENDDLRYLAECRGLQAIGLGGNQQLNASGLRYLVQLPNLEYLYLGQTRVNLEMAIALSQLSNVRLLDLNGCGVDNRCLPHLANMRSLEDLGLTNNKISDDGINALLKLKLQTLRLTETDITDAAVETLSTMTSLQVLSLTENGLTDRSVDSLKKLSNLRWLQIDRNPISASAISKLVSLNQLVRLDIHECKWNEAEFAELQRKFPFCDVSNQESFRERLNKGRSPVAED